MDPGQQKKKKSFSKQAPSGWKKEIPVSVLLPTAVAKEGGGRSQRKRAGPQGKSGRWGHRGRKDREQRLLRPSNGLLEQTAVHKSSPPLKIRSGKRTRLWDPEARLRSCLALKIQDNTLGTEIIQN